MAKITLWGMAKWMNESNDDLFSGMEMPEGISKETLIDVILQRGAEFETVYADPYYLQYLIGVWSRKHNRTFTKWAELLAMEYNPLENYDRLEDWLDTGNRSRIGSGLRSALEKLSREQDGVQMALSGLKDTTTDHESGITTTHASEGTANSNNTGTITTGDKDHDESSENKVSAYNSDEYQKKDKNESDAADHESAITSTISNGESDVNGNSTAAQSKTGGTDRNSKTDERRVDRQTGSDERENSEHHADSENEQHGAVHHGRTHGNIGVVTSQAMWQAQWDLVRINVYEECASLFLDEFTLQIY